MRDWLVDFGGSGRPIVLTHALMGRARTWWRTARWLRSYGHVYGVDARGHGRNPKPGPFTTEVFVADLAEVVAELGQATLIGHSMGGLHALGLAASRPELVRGVVVEDMAVDQRGRTVEEWRPLFRTWPEVFESIAHVREFFAGAGGYFSECVEECAGGYRMIAELEDAMRIAAEWGREQYWSFVTGTRAPVLYLEAEYTLMPAGQMAEMAAKAPDAEHVLVPGAAHLAHEDAPEFYRGAVEAFLSRL
ncbi:alpha/beta fold hydrolase [Sciscionella sediminilitoris]|uniref:alpha/beta fold hydrolase n=1 Tax=Sciscionella sediminilitoris TaxID=1445613 RepID=UPI0004DF3101|nr:alpha/beta hydrolase [Sciscionella sp. SE31]